jgi:N-acyl-D-amino-acid deacylase
VKRIAGALLALTLAWALAPGASAEPDRYDILIRNGRIVDGTGNPWYVGDVGIRKGRIAAVGRLPGATARRVIDAGGRVVAPGFIDVHAHVEGNVHEHPTAESFLFDGVTAIVTGNCGGSETDIGGFFRKLREHRVSLNVATLIGHNSVRRAVMGSDDRDPTPEEQRRMEALVERAMREGAVGFATGLIYIPGTYSKTEEVVALARAAARHGGVYASHIRNEGDEIFAAIDEAIAVGRDAGMPVQISHFKLSNKLFWGRSTETIQRVLDARAAGIDVTVDQYPYTASSTNLGVRLPSWALAGGQAKLRERLADPQTRRKIAEEMYRDFTERQGHQNLEWAVVATCRWDESLSGKSISRINLDRGREPTLENEIETVLEMMERGGCQMVYHVMAEEDVVRILQFPYTMVASDAGIREFGAGMPHPRGYGTNARVLGRYVREQGVITLEDAIRRMTSLPAARFGFAERGLLRPGMWADVVIFDPETVADRATFERPHAYSTGFSHVLVNGEVVIENGRHTGARPGQPLFGPAKR